MARRAMGACAMAMGAMAKRAMGGRAMAMGAMAIGARGGLLQQQPLSRGGDQCRDVRGPALKLGRGEPASRGAEPIQLGRARRTAEQAAIAARAGNPINPVVAGTGGGALQCWRVEAVTCRGGFALACALLRSKALQGAARSGSPLGRDMRMGGCGYVYRDACIFLIGIRSEQSSRTRETDATAQTAASSARTVFFCFEHRAEPRRFLLRTRCVTAGRAARDDGIVHLRVTNVSPLHLCFCCMHT